MANIEEINYLKDETKIIIRVPQIKDAEKLIEHVKIINGETTFLIREEEEFNFTIKQQESFIRARVNSDINLFIIAEEEEEGKIIGSCILSGTNLKREKHKMDLNISIQKRYWGLGIGRKLIELSIDWAKEKEVKKIGLKVDTLNIRAVGLYEKLGFEVEGRLLKDKQMSDGSYRNSYLMGLILE